MWACSKKRAARDTQTLTARSLVGLKGYVTNIPAGLMDAGEVVSSYHELWHVEQSFRMSKHDLRARPVFHHTRDAIETHLTVVMATLAVARLLQETTGISIKRIIRTLKPLQDVTINLNGHKIAAQPQITPTAASILKSLHSQGTKVSRVRLERHTVVVTGADPACTALPHLAHQLIVPRAQ